MSQLKRTSVIALLVTIALLNTGYAHAAAGFPGVVMVTTFNGATGWVGLYSPIAPFPLQGIAGIPLNNDFGKTAYSTLVSAVSRVPPMYTCVGMLGANPVCGNCILGTAACGAVFAVGIYP